MMVLPGIEFCQLLMGSKQSVGGKDLFVVELGIHLWGTAVGLPPRQAARTCRGH